MKAPNTKHLQEPQKSRPWGEKVFSCRRLAREYVLYAELCCALMVCYIELNVIFKPMIWMIYIPCNALLLYSILFCSILSCFIFSSCVFDTKLYLTSHSWEVILFCYIVLLEIIVTYFMFNSWMAYSAHFRFGRCHARILGPKPSQRPPLVGPVLKKSLAVCYSLRGP